MGASRMARKRNTSGRGKARTEHRDDQAPDTAGEAEEHFVRGLLARGEAAKRVDGELPAEATHEIVEEPEGELPKVRRRRFSAF
jgi:hypothetical protein